MLQIDNARIAFEEDILFSKFCVQLKKDETVCITGEPGCGKTSLLNAITGLVPLREGRIRVGDILLEPVTIDIIRRYIAWIPQELALPSEWVKEVIALPFALKANRHVSFSEEKLFTYSNKLGLDKDLYQEWVGEISGRQRQRIMIAAATMLEKSLTIVDEPTSALDSSSTDRVLAFLHDQTAKRTAMPIVSHDRAFTYRCNQLATL